MQTLTYRFWNCGRWNTFKWSLWCLQNVKTGSVYQFVRRVDTRDDEKMNSNISFINKFLRIHFNSSVVFSWTVWRWSVEKMRKNKPRSMKKFGGCLEDIYKQVRWIRIYVCLWSDVSGKRKKEPLIYTLSLKGNTRRNVGERCIFASALVLGKCRFLSR